MENHSTVSGKSFFSIQILLIFVGHYTVASFEHTAENLQVT